MFIEKCLESFDILEDKRLLSQLTRDQYNAYYKFEMCTINRQSAQKEAPSSSQTCPIKAEAEIIQTCAWAAWHLVCTCIRHTKVPAMASRSGLAGTDTCCCCCCSLTVMRWCCCCCGEDAMSSISLLSSASLMAFSSCSSWWAGAVDSAE